MRCDGELVEGTFTADSGDLDMVAPDFDIDVMKHRCRIGGVFGLSGGPELRATARHDVLNAIDWEHSLIVVVVAGENQVHVIRLE